MSEKKGLFKFLHVDKIIDGFAHLVETRIAIAKLELKEEVARIVKSVTAVLMIVAFLMIALLFLSAGLAFWLNLVLNSVFLGFIVVGAIYIVVAVIMHYNKKALPIKRFVQKLMNQPDEDEDE